MIAYASRTGTRRNLDALRAAGWRLMVSARGALRTEGFRYALDNGAWTSHQRNESFHEAAFRKALYRLGPESDWTVIPDIVGGGRASLALSLRWMSEVLDHSPRALLAVQDGMLPADVEHLLGRRVGLFVGGTTNWKESSLPMWGALSRQAGCWFHVGRVNTRRRILMCGVAGAKSFDGTSATRFASVIPLLDWSRRQCAMALWEEAPCLIA